MVEYINELTEYIGTHTFWDNFVTLAPLLIFLFPIAIGFFLISRILWHSLPHKSKL